MMKQRNEKKKKRAVREGKVYDLALFKKKYINFFILNIPNSTFCEALDLLVNQLGTSQMFGEGL